MLIYTTRNTQIIMSHALFSEKNPTVQIKKKKTFSPNTKYTQSNDTKYGHTISISYLRQNNRMIVNVTHWNYWIKTKQLSSY